MKKYIFHGLMPFLVKLLYDVSIYNCLPQIYFYGIEYGKVFNFNKILPGWVVFFVINLISVHYLVHKRNDNISILLLILYYFYYIPVSSAFYINDLPYLYLIFTAIYWSALVFLASKTFVFGINHHRNSESNLLQIRDSVLMKSKLFYVVCFTVDIACIVYTYLYNGFSLTLNITDIYDARAEFVGSTNVVTSFLFNFGGSLLIGISMYYGLKYRKYMLTIIGFFSQLGIYSIARQKSNLLIIGIVFLIYVVEKINLLHRIKELIAWGAVGLVGIPLLEYFIFRTTALFTLLPRRMLYYPAWLSGLYYRFFCENKVLLLTQDAFLVRRLGINRYNESVLKLINNAYFKGFVSSPNTGLFGEAYMHFGVAGVFLFPIIDIFLLKWLMKYVDRYDKGLQIYIVYEISMALINIPITSGMFWITYMMIIPMTFIISKFYIGKFKTS